MAFSGVTFGLLFALATFGLSQAQSDYCSINCGNGKGRQTMCLFKNSKPSAACGQVLKNTLGSDEQNRIVKKHNQLRSKVAAGNEKRGNPGPQPAASNMGDLTWDDELAKVAQRWANQCKFAHDECRNVDRFTVGQNIAITWTTGDVNSSLEDLIQMWYDEVKDFNSNEVTSLQSYLKTGHYTQLIWAKSKYIGCGQTSYKSNGRKTLFLVCNYGPAGNYIGQPVYDIKQ